VKATLWLGPQDGAEIAVSADVVRTGRYYVTGHGKAGVLRGSYALKVASDGVAVLDSKRRLTFEWVGWTWAC